MTIREVTRSLCAATVLSACGLVAPGEGGNKSTVAVQVQPPSAIVRVGGGVGFAAAVTGAVDVSVTWTLEPAGCGTVTPAGLYTAPASPATCQVRATSRADATRSGTASITVVSDPPVGGEVLAFPGAEGFGARATGGRGGQVIKVTNLNSSGPGSLQAALDVNAPRIVVFAVSGVIDSDVDVNYGNVTIAGQTAPGGGITIAGHLFGAYDHDVQNIIVRHVRVRPPRCSGGCDADQYDAIQFSRNSRLILDHISVAYGADETVDVYEASDVTIQWTTIEASQISPQHSDGATHNYGLIQGPDASRMSLHHNLFAHHRKRSPAVANGPCEVRNNVMYDSREAFVHHNPATGNFNIIGNYFKDGPSAALLAYWLDTDDQLYPARYHTRDSYVDDPAAGVTQVIDNIWSNHYWGDLCSVPADCGPALYASSEFDFSGTPGHVSVTTTSAQTAYTAVLAGAGAWPRDGFTTSTITEVTNRTGAWNPDLPANLMAGLTPGTAPTDADNDGMADSWETAHGLNPASGADHGTVMPSGYTAIEDYVNQLAAALVP